MTQTITEEETLELDQQFVLATHDLAIELGRFIDNLQLKCNCSPLEATLLARAILASLLDNLGDDSMKEMSEFLAQVRELVNQQSSKKNN